MNNTSLVNIGNCGANLSALSSKSGAETIRPLNFKEWKESHPNVLGNAERRMAYASYKAEACSAMNTSARAVLDGLIESGFSISKATASKTGDRYTFTATREKTAEAVALEAAAKVSGLDVSIIKAAIEAAKARQAAVNIKTA